MNRFPAGTPYLGPTMCYDDMIEPEQLIRRLVYGTAKPLLGDYERLTAQLFGKLVDGLSNSHTVLVKAARGERSARRLLAQLRQEFPPEVFEFSVVHAPERGEWMVMAYNAVPKHMRVLPKELSGTGSRWVDVKEVARVLGLKDRRAIEVIKASGVEQKRVGGLNRIMIRQQDLIILANRPRRWRKKRPKVSI